MSLPSMRSATRLLRLRGSALSSHTRSPSVLASFARSYSDAPAPAPPLLQKLKGDLKTAMRAKDTARLTVLRAALSATLNASKTSSPITTDAGLVALLRKQGRGCADARDEAAAAGRPDLVAKEESQISVLEEYIAGSGIEELSHDQIKAIVEGVIAGLGEKPKHGDVMKTLLAAGGPLDGKNVEKGELARVVKEVNGA